MVEQLAVVVRFVLDLVVAHTKVGLSEVEVILRGNLGALCRSEVGSHMLVQFAELVRLGMSLV